MIFAMVVLKSAAVRVGVDIEAWAPPVSDCERPMVGIPAVCCALDRVIQPNSSSGRGSTVSSIQLRVAPLPGAFGTLRYAMVVLPVPVLFPSMVEGPGFTSFVVNASVGLPTVAGAKLALWASRVALASDAFAPASGGSPGGPGPLGFSCAISSGILAGGFFFLVCFAICILFT